jgi:hypothetical protein
LIYYDEVDRISIYTNPWRLEQCFCECREHRNQSIMGVWFGSIVIWTCRGTRGALRGSGSTSHIKSAQRTGTARTLNKDLKLQLSFTKGGHFAADPRKRGKQDQSYVEAISSPLWFCFSRIDKLKSIWVKLSSLTVMHFDSIINYNSLVILKNNWF